MDKRELRIDNWVLSNNAKPFQVYAETFNDIEAGYLIPVPIPLTDEILIKAGFEKTKNGIIFILKDFAISLRSADTIICFWDNTELTRDIKYLHQLQNLYYILVGEELQINL